MYEVRQKATCWQSSLLTGTSIGADQGSRYHSLQKPGGLNTKPSPWILQEADAQAHAADDNQGPSSQPSAARAESPRQYEWPRSSKLTPRSHQQAVINLELNPENQDKGLRQQLGRRRRVQARAAAYARWHHGPAPAPPRQLPAALPEPLATTLDGEVPVSSMLVGRCEHLRKDGCGGVPQVYCSEIPSFGRCRFMPCMQLENK